VKALLKYPDNKFVFISGSELAMPDYIKELDGLNFTETDDLEDTIGKIDVLYMTRIQRERFDNPKDYERQAGKFVIDGITMQKAKTDLVLLHPLPRVDEIAVEVDDDPRALYFKQATYGMYIRMALILKLINREFPDTNFSGGLLQGRVCENPKCITKAEKYLKALFNGRKCVYCESELN
jgi:aspartate carbamoyltransferase catalytic subunit